MGFDFGALPPEITSALMYAGPGPSSMLAASFAWKGLAAELNSAATAYDAQITTLSGDGWQGPAAAAMAQAAQPYVAWMSQTAAQAEQAAAQAMAAVAAFEGAFAETVPPPVVAANRTQLAQLVATNVMGQNLPAIAATEAHYGQMWAQNATTMYTYAANSATAATVTPFSTPAPSTNPAGQALQSAAVTSAAAASAGTAQSTISQSMSTVQSLLGQLASPTTVVKELGLTPLSTSTLAGMAFDPSSLVGSMLTGIGGSSTLNPQWLITAFRNFAGPLYNIEGMPYFATGMANTMLSLSKGLAPAASAAAGGAAAHGLAGLGGMLGGGAGGAGQVAAGLGNAASVGGKLSVPATWAGAAPALSPSTAPLPISTISAAPEAGGPGNLLGGMPLAGAAGGAGHGGGPKYGFRPTVMARPPFAG